MKTTRVTHSSPRHHRNPTTQGTSCSAQCDIVPSQLMLPGAQASTDVMGATGMSTTFGAGFHAAPGKTVDASAYERWTGRWSRLFIPVVLAAAAVGPKCRVLDVSTGTGEAARMALSLVGTEGVVVGADISPEMLTSARAGLHGSPFLPVAADGQALPFSDTSFDAVVCQLGLQFFPDPARGVGEFRRVSRADRGEFASRSCRRGVRLAPPCCCA